MQTIGCAQVFSTIPRYANGMRFSNRSPISSPRVQHSMRTGRRRLVCDAESSVPIEPSEGAQPAKTSGLLDYVLGQGTYRFLSIAFAFTAAVYGFGDVGVFEKIFLQKPTVLQNFFFRSFGWLLIVPAAMCHRMQASVAANRIDSPTYKRMGFAVAFAFLVLFGSKYYYISQGMSMAPLAVFYSNLLHILPTVSYLKVYGFSEMSNLLPGLISGIKSLFQPDNPLAAVYAVMAGVFGILFVNATLLPTKTASFFVGKQLDLVSALLMRAIALMASLLAVACFTLKDGADRKRLGFSTFKALNYGASIAAIGNLGVMQYLANKFVTKADVATAIMTTNGWNIRITVLLIFGLFCGYQALTATKN